MDPEIKRAIDEARPQLERLGIDPAELEGGDPEVVVPKLLEHDIAVYRFREATSLDTEVYYATRATTAVHPIAFQ